MPAIIGPVHITSVNGGTVHFGDSLYVSPKSNSKSTTGQGSSNTGGFIVTNNGLNASNVFDADLLDQPSVGNT